MLHETFHDTISEVEWLWWCHRRCYFDVDIIVVVEIGQETIIVVLCTSWFGMVAMLMVHLVWNALC